MAAKRCLICSGHFKGRTDAKTCSPRCRKRLQQVRFSLAHNESRRRGRANKIIALILLGLFGLFSVFINATPQKAQALTAANDLNFQARLLNAAGAVVPDGNYNIDFKIYNADSVTGTVGTCNVGSNCLWEETYLVASSQGVAVTNGYFSVNLNSLNNNWSNAINWDQQYYLTMNVTTNGTTSCTPRTSCTWNGEMQNATHSIALTSVPLAFRANQLAVAGTNEQILQFASSTFGQTTTISLQDPGATTANVCYETAGGAVNHTCAAATGGSGYIQNSTGGPQAANFNIISNAAGSIGGIIHANAGQSVDIFDVNDSGATVYLGVSSNGSLSVSPATAGTITLGTATQTGTITIGQATTATTQAVNIESANGTASTQTVTIGGGSSTTSGGKVVNLATGAAGTGTTNTVHIADTAPTGTGTNAVTVGTNTNASTVSILGGTGTGTGSAGIKLQPATGGDVFIGNTGGTGTIIIGSSTGANPVQIANGSGASAVSIANVQNGGSVAIGAGFTTGTFAIGGTATTGAITIGQTTTGTTAAVNILSANGTASTQTITIGGGTSTTSGGKVVNIATGAAGTGTANTVHIADTSPTGTGTNAVTIGSNSAANNVTILQGGVNGANETLQLQVAASGIIGIGTANTTKTIDVGSVGSTAAASTIKIANTTDGTNTQSVSIGSNANVNDVVNLDAGNTGGINIGTSTTAHAINIGTGGTNTQAVNIGSINGSSAVQIFGGTTGTTINLQSGTGGTIAIGSANGNTVNIGGNVANTPVNITSGGTGNITLTSNSSTTGTVIKSGTNSTSAFQVQTASGDNALAIDTTNSLGTIISNPSFEQSLSGWAASGTGASVSQVTTQSYQGQASLKFVTGTAAGNSARYTVGSQLSTSTTYTLSFYAKTDSATFLTLSASYSPDGSTTNENDCAVFTPSGLVDSGWTQYTCTIDTTTTAATGSGFIAIKQTDATSRNVYIDGVQLTAGGSITSGQVQEVGFESALSSWANLSSTSVAQSAADHLDGADDLLITGSSTANSGAKYTTTATSPKALLASTTYQLSFWAKASGSNFSTLQATYSQAGTTGGEVACILNNTTVVTTAWQYYTCTFTTSGTAPVAASYFAIEHTDGVAHTWTVDNVQLTKTSLITTPSQFKESGIQLNGNITTPVNLQNTAGSSYLYADAGSSTISVNGAIYSRAVVPAGINGSFSTGHQLQDIKIQGNYGYIADNTGNALTVLDMSNPASPVQVGTVSTGGSTSPQALAISGRYAYVALFTSSQLNVYDISNPATPTLIGSGLTLSNNLQSIVVQGKYAYIASGAAQIFVVDISNPATPLLVSTFSATGNVYSLAVSGKYLYAVNSSPNLQIVDISNPSSPTSVGTAALGGAPYCGGGTFGPNMVAVAGKYAYVTVCSLNLVRIFDVSNPASPSAAGLTPMSTANGIAVSIQGDYAYVAEYSTTNAIQYFDLTNITSPVSLGTVTAGTGTPGPIAITAVGRNVYVADWLDGKVSTYDFSSAYLQQFEAGGAELGTLSVDSNSMFAGDLSIQGAVGVGNGLQVAGGVGIVSTGTGTSSLSINNSSTNINLLDVKDLSQNFGSAVTAGAFISRNSYFGEEFNSIKGTCSDTGALSTKNNVLRRGDMGNPVAACTSNTGEISTSSINTAAAGGSCVYSSLNDTNGVERIASTGTATANDLCMESLGTNTAGTNQVLYNTSNLPVIQMKFHASITDSAHHVFAGISTLGGAKGAPASTDKGIYFSNCTAPSSATCGSTWSGIVNDGATAPNSATSTNAVACPATDSQGSSAQTTNMMYGRIENTIAPSGTSVSITFYIDYDVTNGIVETKCGTVSSIGNSGGLTSVAMSMFLDASTALSATVENFDIDYFRSWQDDAAPSADTSTDTSSGTAVTETQAPITPDPDQPDPNTPGSFFNFLGATSEDMVINGNLFVHGTIYADKIKANQIEGLSIFTDQLDSLTAQLNAVKAASTSNVSGSGSGSSGSAESSEGSNGALTLNIGASGLTVGGDANFQGNVFFYKLVTFVQKTVFNEDVSFNGHITTGGGLPTINLETAAGLSVDPQDGQNHYLAQKSISGNDNSGKLSVTIGDNASAGEVFNVKFNKQFSDSPNVFLTSTNQAAASLRYYVTTTNDGFKITILDSPIPGTMLNFNYLVIQ